MLAIAAYLSIPAKVLQLRFEQVLQSQSNSCSRLATLDWRLNTNPPYPVRVNDVQLSEMAPSTASIRLGSARFAQLMPHMAAEHFAYYAQKAPVCFSTLGSCNRSAGSRLALKSCRLEQPSPWEYLHNSFLISIVGTLPSS